jgi:hypothetical protein
MTKREEIASAPEKMMLSTDDYRAWKQLVERGFTQYGLKKTDLADQQRRTTDRDRLLEKAGVQRRTIDPLQHKTRDQIRRLVENALSRRCAAETARLIIWRIMNAKVACAWRSANVSGPPDTWQREVIELVHRGIQYVTAAPPPQKSVIRAFIHPKGVEVFVRETLADLGTLIPPRKREAVATAMIESISQNNELRTKAVADWFMQSDGFIDVRVFEGPWRDPQTGTVIQVRETRHRRVKLFDPREPLAAGEREPRAHERLRAVMRDTFTDSFEPQASRLIVLPTIHAANVNLGDGNIRISAEAIHDGENLSQK